jgi:NADH-quinone oxidoreductase subunit N
MLTANNLIPISAELWLLIAASGILLWDAIKPSGHRSQLLTQIALFIALAINVGYFAAGNTLHAWSGMFVSDPLANLLKAACTLATMITLHYAQHYVVDRGMHQGELYVLAITALMGQMLMVSSSHMLMLYLGLELMSLSLYALVALRRDHARSTEAAMKYFVLGAMASGFLLYGISMLYGATGTLDMTAIFKALESGAGLQNRPTAILASVFIVAGLAFKFGAVPFHMWVPDVYDGSPTVVTLLIASAPKLAALGMALRIMVQAMLPLAADWQPMFLFLGIASIAVGNVVAVMQSSFKRMLAYSTISHIGFVVLALAVGVVGTGASARASAVDAYGAAVFYMLTYVLTTVLSFGVILLLARAGHECDNIDDLKGLAKRSPTLAIVMLLVMFSLAGVPPLVGFWAKLEVLRALMVAGHIGVMVVAVLFSLIGAFYYLRVLKTVFFDPAVSVTSMDSHPDQTVQVPTLFIVNGAAILVLGLLPGWLIALSVNAAKSLFIQ